MPRMTTFSHVTTTGDVYRRRSSADYGFVVIVGPYSDEYREERLARGEALSDIERVELAATNHAVLSWSRTAENAERSRAATERSRIFSTVYVERVNGGQR